MSNTKEILSKAYTRRLTPDEGGGYVATIMEFPGCVAEGDSADEALSNLDEAASSWLEVAIAHGQHVREPVDLSGFSGKIALRMPRSLHRQVAELAFYEGTSLNQLLVAAIAHYVGGKQLAHELTTNNIFQIKNFNWFTGNIPVTHTARSLRDSSEGLVIESLRLPAVPSTTHYFPLET